MAKAEIDFFDLSVNKMFPCPVCASPCPVKQTKKAKPYIVCHPCGIQVFVRGPEGIAAFNKLVETAVPKDVWAKIKEMEPRYRLKCPQCGHRFWIEPELIKTSFFDGSLEGFRCPIESCDSTVPWEKK